MTTQYVGPDTVGGPQPQNLSTPNSRASVTVEEATGSGQDTETISTYIHLLGQDVHSEPDLYGYAESPLVVMDPTEVVHSFERWFRLKFEPPFNAIFGMRFFVTSPDLGPGWLVSWGTASDYQTPVVTTSAIATNPLPTTDPGQDAPNIGGYSRLPGTETQYSDWIVMQATADPNAAGVGPAAGFTAEGTLIPITFTVTWVED